MFVGVTEKLTHCGTGAMSPNGNIKWDRSEAAAANYNGTMTYVKVKCKDCGLESNRSFNYSGAMANWDKVVFEETQLRKTIVNKNW